MSEATSRSLVGDVLVGLLLSAMVVLVSGYAAAFSWASEIGVILALDLSPSGFRSSSSGWYFAAAEGVIIAVLIALLLVGNRAPIYIGAATGAVVCLFVAVILRDRAGETSNFGWGFLPYVADSASVYIFATIAALSAFFFRATPATDAWVKRREARTGP